ncbi:hypothetical protein CALVIDRAFT_12827 [Calocera viscosa TUFC12733]|uniref:Uncharacterized protein n=1 Tax=Calocera viscosa (strain TUFC12733) TaxID=1330018 RepID=A0A167S687_CALVF|nr:hypothetical protein CALVIDRAFT_12827 [Calocera viscosa TUFC12733]
MATPLSPQPDSLPLERGALYVVLFHLPSLYPPKYHWALGLITSTGTVFSYHAIDEALRRGSGSQNWIFERRSEGAWYQTRTRHVALKIGKFVGHESVLSSLLATIPLVVVPQDRLQEAQFGCRLWVRYAVSLLAARRVIQFRGRYTAVDLEVECDQVGGQYHERLRPGLRLWDVSWPLFVTDSGFVIL